MVGESPYEDLCVLGVLLSGDGQHCGCGDGHTAVVVVVGVVGTCCGGGGDVVGCYDDGGSSGVAAVRRDERAGSLGSDCG